jgi:carbon storage regulator CsrA
MLVISRNETEEVTIGPITVRVVRAANGRARLGITAPIDIAIRRTELPENESIDRTKLAKRISKARLREKYGLEQSNAK